MILVSIFARSLSSIKHFSITSLRQRPDANPISRNVRLGPLEATSSSNRASQFRSPGFPCSRKSYASITLYLTHTTGTTETASAKGSLGASSDWSDMTLSCTGAQDITSFLLPTSPFADCRDLNERCYLVCENRHYVQRNLSKRVQSDCRSLNSSFDSSLPTTIIERIPENRTGPGRPRP